MIGEIIFMPYDRLSQWKKFSKQVEAHILEYTLPQYGNQEGDEQVDEFTAEDCWKNIDRYKNRRKSCTRGEVEQLRDVIKIAHYAQFIFDKMCEERKVGGVYKIGAADDEWVEVNIPYGSWGVYSIEYLHLNVPGVLLETEDGDFVLLGHSSPNGAGLGSDGLKMNVNTIIKRYKIVWDPDGLWGGD